MLALVIGYACLRGSHDTELLREQDNELIAEGTLADALETWLSGSQPEGGDVRIGPSFRSRGGGPYCRTFTLLKDPACAGIACREAGFWRVRALTPHGHDSAREGASAPPASLRDMVQNEIEEEPLDAAGERAARDAHWRGER
jgi:hypothetical protein